MSVASLSELPLFAGLAPAETSELESRMRRREYAPPQTIVREGGAGDAAYLIMTRLVAVRHKDPDSGVEFLLAELGPGQMFGEMALITGKPRNATVVAINETTCAVLDRNDFERALKEHPGIALALAQVMAERLKILSKLDIAEKRLPQDGRFAVTLDGTPIDFRVSTVPGKWGEKVVLRILDKSNTQLGLDELITDAATLALVRDMIQQPYGIIYVTGPTGSGKTTSLYSALAEINDPGVNISTAEDPIEYDLPGVTQIQASPSIGLTFAAILRGFLRQDPDVMLVGETRDKETAHTAVEAALTGHLVFTTLHTNNAAVAFTRLGEMGIEPFLVSSSTIGVIAQRLARRLCQNCKEEYEPDEETRRFIGLPPGAMLYRGRGCAKCGGKGMKGRVGIYEVMRLTPALRQLVAKGSSAEEIHAAALAGGMVDLKGYAALMLAQGLTTIEEVTSVVSMQA